jgi:hypothetical protein
MKQLFTLVALSLCLASHTASADCDKWDAGLDICSTSPTVCGCSGAPSNCQEASFAQTRNYFNKLFSDGAQAACEQAIYYSSYQGTAVTAKGPGGSPLAANADVAFCWLAGGSTAYTSVWLESIEREAMCERTPNGPYTSLGTAGTDGASFTTTKRTNIRNANMRRNGGVLRSEAGVAAPPPGTPIAGEPYNALGYNGSIFSHESDMWIPYINGPALANVDHIIPRKDIYGCDCGPSSYANMLIISWDLNNRMSNDSEHPDRQALLDMWTLP